MKTPNITMYIHNVKTPETGKKSNFNIVEMDKSWEL